VTEQPATGILRGLDGVVIVSPALAAELAGPVERMLREEQRRGRRWSPATILFAQNLERAARSVDTHVDMTGGRALTPRTVEDVSSWPTVAQAAERLGVQRQALYARIKRGTWPRHEDAAGQLRVPPQLLEES
jgi:hypothetical protein